MSLYLSNEQLRSIAAEFGTPLYLYNANRITEQYNILKQSFNSDKVRFFYACKALTNLSILKHIKSIGCNVDCSSINEAKLAIHAGFSPQDILYTSNGIAFDEIEEAVLKALEIAPPELSADIYDNGIHLTGGGALLKGLDKRLHQKTKLPIHIAEDPLRAVVRGTGTALKNISNFRTVLMS